MKMFFRFFMIFIPLLLVGSAIAAYLIFTGPRMREQPSVSTYERKMPLPPPGSVPVQGNMPTAPSPADQATFKIPTASQKKLEKGEVIYGYYCIFCHGENGSGNGPVGESYQPLPTDLRSPKVTSISDARLLKAMLTGIGHEPVLGRVVPTEYRGLLALYVRSLANTSSLPVPVRESRDKTDPLREVESGQPGK